MGHIVLAEYHLRLPVACNFWVGVVKPHFLICLLITFSLVLDESGDVTEIVCRMVLAGVDSLTFAVTTACNVELPLSILLQLVVLVERA